jgi:hypothetical protein
MPRKDNETMKYTIKTPVKISTDKLTGYTYVVEGKETILARCNSRAVANEIVDAINNINEMRYKAGFLPVAIGFLRELIASPNSTARQDARDWLDLMNE